MTGEGTLLPYSPSPDELAAQIVSAYVSNNAIQGSDVGPLFQSVREAIVGSTAPAADPVETVEKPTPAQIKKSITPDAITSFIDGKAYKTLKRHLGTHGLDPYSYRARYGLPADYPMVAPNYAVQRSGIAKKLGLGLRRPAADAA